MPQIVQELSKDFPEHEAMLRHLNETDGHFHRICVAYHDLGALLKDGTLVATSGMASRFEVIEEQHKALRQEILGLLERPETVEDILP